MAGHDRWIVLKFGGTSVSRRERWDTIGQLVRERADTTGARVLVVVSALSGVTNELQAMADGDAIADRCAALVARHRAFATALGLDPDEAPVAARLQALAALPHHPRAGARELAWQAEVLAQGELLSSTLGVAYLRAQGLDLGWCDARDWLDALPLPNQTPWSLRLCVSCRTQPAAGWRARFDAQSPRLLLTQGFVARHQDGGSAILGRGGSDTSAACFGALLGAGRVEIWTDVPGMFSANPREVPEARLITRLDYAEAQEIATTGAKVLHPRAIGPCREARVPMAILDTARPQLPGTRIDASVETVPGVKAISRRNGIVLVSMESVGMWQQVGFLADVFERFKRHGLSVDLIGSSETNVTVSLDPSDNLVNGNVLEALSADLARICRVKVIVPCAAITLVGRGMRSMLHRLSDIWATFGRERVHLVSQSSNDLNLTFVVDEADAEGLVPLLHEEVVRSGAMPMHEGSVFGPTWREVVHGRQARAAPWWVAGREQLLQLAARGSPRYAYHLPTVRTRARALRALGTLDRFYYALKANPHPALLRTLAAEGFGFACASSGEVEQVFAAVPGLDPQRVVFTPSFAAIDEYAGAFARGCIVTVDNLELLRQWPDVFRGRDAWLRLDLGRGAGRGPALRSGDGAARFGLPTPQLDAFLAQARALGMRVTGLHAHPGSEVQSAAHWRDAHAELCLLAEAIPTVDTIDIGGGLPVPYVAGEAPFDLSAWAADLATIKAAYPQYALTVEPGRYLVAEAGVLLLHATQRVEKAGVQRLGCDAGMNALLRPALYEAWHEVANLSRLDAPHDAIFDLVGPICERADVLAVQRKLPSATAPGDVILLADTGAYGMALANTYHLRPLPAEDILDD